jgi:hypothetical protein
MLLTNAANLIQVDGAVKKEENNRDECQPTAAYSP